MQTKYIEMRIESLSFRELVDSKGKYTLTARNGKGSELPTVSIGNDIIPCYWIGAGLRGLVLVSISLKQPNPHRELTQPRSGGQLTTLDILLKKHLTKYRFGGRMCLRPSRPCSQFILPGAPFTTHDKYQFSSKGVQSVSEAPKKTGYGR
jgi:hypothetical protein